MSLIAACGSPRLMEMQEMLYDQTFRYRSVMLRVVNKARAFDPCTPRAAAGSTTSFGRECRSFLWFVRMHG
jgi:hypothetical protein